MAKLPAVLIVGRPNVGKSTLFNRLTGRATALVFDRPGVTRDLIESEIQIGNISVRLLDSAGWPYPSSDADLNQKINEKVERTMKSCDLILWIVDGREGRTGAEEALAERLNSHRRKVILVVNKLDEFKPDRTWADSDFAGLPWSESFPLSAKHGRGVGDLLTLLETRLAKHRGGTDEDETGKGDVLKLCVLGRPNVGKSTLVNLLLKQDRMVVSDRPGTTRDAIETGFVYQGRTIRLVDTPGVRRNDRIVDGLERTMARIALITAGNADVGLLILDISQGLVEQDLRLVTHLWDRGVTTVVAANKWDLAEERAGGTARALEDKFRQRMFNAADVPFILISAKTGHGITRLMKTVFDVAVAAQTRIRTPELNRKLHAWNGEFPPSLFQGKPGKLKYAVQTKTVPVSFKIFVNDKKTFRREALRYLERRFRETFGLHGVPIQLHLDESRDKR